MAQQPLQKLQQDQQAAAAARGSGYAFLDPAWKPPDDTDAGTAGTRSATAIAHEVGLATGDAQARLSESKGSRYISSGTVGGGSFTSLLGKARSAKAGSREATAASFGPEPLEQSAQVTQTLAQLQEMELAAARLVADTLKRQEGVASKGKRRTGARLNQKSQEFLHEQQRLQHEPKVSCSRATTAVQQLFSTNYAAIIVSFVPILTSLRYSIPLLQVLDAWEELLRGERGAQGRFHELMSAGTVGGGSGVNERSGMA